MKPNLLAQMEGLIKTQGENITDEYMKGMYNGMVLMKSLIDGKKPKYIKTIK